MLVTITSIAPNGLLETVAGLALLGTFAHALLGALSQEEYLLPAALTFVTAAAGISFWGIGGAFWALVVGLVAHGVLRRRDDST